MESSKVNPPNSIYRYMRVGALLEWIDTGQLNLSSPLTWDDQVDRHWFDVLACRCKIALEESAGRVFGLCFSKEYYSEALWKRFGHVDDVVRITLDLQRLAQLSTTWKSDGALEVALTPVEYGKASELAKSAVDVLDQLRNGPICRQLLDLWRLKTEAFRFEGEWRLLVLMRDRVPASQRKVAFEAQARGLVKSILLDSRMNPGFRKHLRDYLTERLDTKIESTIVNRVPRQLLQLTQGSKAV